MTDKPKWMKTVVEKIVRNTCHQFSLLNPPERRLQDDDRQWLIEEGVDIIEEHCPEDKARGRLVEALCGIKDMAKRYGTIPDSGNQTVGEYQWALRQLNEMACAALADYENGKE